MLYTVSPAETVQVSGWGSCGAVFGRPASALRHFQHVPHTQPACL
jgi:hypothetical protein